MSLISLAKEAVLRLARVPAEPHVPEGARESVQVFNAGKNYYALLLILWALANITIALALAALFGISFLPKLPPLGRTIFRSVDAVAATLFLISVPITYFLQRLNYEMRWYIVTDRSLRIRSGIIWLEEITMTFTNIQEIRVNANPVERLLGLANVQVRSAGGGDTVHGQSSTGHIGNFAGVDNAEAIRDLLTERLRIYRESGLGEKAADSIEPPAISAARQVLEETKALRLTLRQQQ